MNPQRKPHSAGDVIEAQGDKILVLTQRLELADALAKAVEALPYPRNEYGSAEPFCSACGYYEPEHGAECEFTHLAAALAEYRKARGQ